METQALNQETTHTAGTDLSFQTAVSSISDARSPSTKETNVEVHPEVHKVNNTDSSLATPELPWKQQAQEG